MMADLAIIVRNIFVRQVQETTRTVEITATLNPPRTRTLALIEISPCGQKPERRSRSEGLSINNRLARRSQELQFSRAGSMRDAL